jgi:undecaprenyl-diphosphatase
LIKLFLDWDIQLSNRLRISPVGCAWWRPAALLAHSGDSWFWASGLAILWLVSNPFWRRLTAILLIAIVLQALIVFPLKMAIRRQRPAGEWGSFYRQFDPHSFPSGHAARAVLLMVLSIALGPAWFGWLIAIWAPVMALSRVMTGVHYISDVVGGMLLGLVLGQAVLAVYPVWMQWFPFLF